MNQTRVLLTVEQRLHSQLLKHTLLSRNDVELIGEAKSVVDSLMMIASEKPDLWIHSLDGEGLDALLSHAFSLQPNLGVAKVSLDDPSGCLQFQVNSISQLISITNRTRPLLDDSDLEFVGNSS